MGARRSGPLCVLSALGVLLGTLAVLGVGVTPVGVLLPVAIVAWLVFAGLELRRRRFGWVLASLPVAVLPLLVLALVVYRCARGDCF